MESTQDDHFPALPARGHGPTIRDILPDRLGTDRAIFLEVNMAGWGGKAPKHLIWIVCLVLYLVALLAHFGVFRVSAGVSEWSWIIGFGLLLAAVQLRGV